jgi:hypothetical protein
MMTDHVRLIFERVVHRMVHAGWLKSDRYSVETGHELVWRTEGAQKALFLRDLVEHFELAGSSRVLGFDLACRGLDLPDGALFREIDIEVSAFWLMCVAELGIEPQSEELLGLVQIVTSWSPDQLTSSTAG